LHQFSKAFLQTYKAIIFIALSQKMNFHFKLFVLALLISSCNSGQEKSAQTQEEKIPTFKLLTAAESGIDFRNDVKETKAFNYFRYSYMYNGGGVSVGDINNDGLPDIYFTANQGSNKLYLNKGNLRFEDITEKAGLSDATGWTTGVSFFDFNNDGLLDIYVCKSGLVAPEERKNKLFLNNGDLTFTEVAAAWGLDDDSYSTQAYFIDYDMDGDMDLYLVNHRIDFTDNISVDLEKEKIIDPETSDRLYRNDGGKFTNVTKEAGLENKAWGLAAAIGDFNNDGLPDIYVCNDFRQPDHLYLNQGNGTFKDGILEHFGHISYYSMGADLADINNDGLLDLMVLDMVSEDHVRSKRMMGAMNSESFNRMVDIGYHRQYMFNMLHLNQGNGDFANISQLAGVAKTDWSWAPLFADFDNDGFSDLFITNGIRRDVTDVDFKNEVQQRYMVGQPMSFQEVLERWPSAKVANYMYRNNGNLQFENRTKDWGFNQAINSNGIAYADLDGDGDLDLIINNIDDPASVYENQLGGNHLKVKLIGPENNPMGLGAQVILKNGTQQQMRDLYLSRGFQSSVEPVLHFGLGAGQTIEELRIIWPDRKTQVLRNVSSNQTLTLQYADASESYEPQQVATAFESIDPKLLGIDFKHAENTFNDFAREILLPHKQSALGPLLSVGDINGDGLDDFFIAGAKGQASATYVQTTDGKFVKTNQQLWTQDAAHEDIGSLFFDADGDGDLDLYVVSGGNEFTQNDPLLQDRLYFNDGKGNFTKRPDALPKMLTSGQRVIAADIDGDGDLDLFVGGRLLPGLYPFAAVSYLLGNDGGKFVNITPQAAPELTQIGMITDAVFTDYDGDGDPDLVVVGEWTPIMLFENNKGSFKVNANPSGLEKTNAWWYSISAADMDGDGDVDFVVGNLGLNNKFQPTKEKPLHVFCNDFDQNGSYDIVLSKEGYGTLLPVRGRECSAEQMPFIEQKFPTYTAFANADLRSIYGEQALANALHYVAYDFTSVYVENLGQGNFKVHPLPIEAQFGPTLATTIVDINEDGHLDIIGVGAMHDAEIETVRYDSNRGYVLLGNGKGSFNAIKHTGLHLNNHAKDISRLIIKDVPTFIISNNNNQVDLRRIK
jgi:enediyne biosynthesis protein E4